MNHPAAALQLLVAALENAGIRYAVGGSVASSAIGLPRATLDTDILAEMRDEQIIALAGPLRADWYFDAESACTAFAHRRAFNLIHLPSGFKFDLFPAHSEFHRSELIRAVVRRLSIAETTVTCLVVTAEDIILAKLLWYRDSGETSERQWADVTDMLSIGGNLDWPYLHKWAAQLGVDNLLNRALRSASH